MWAKGWSPEEYARHFQSLNGGLVVLTLGSGGALAIGICDRLLMLERLLDALAERGGVFVTAREAVEEHSARAH